jgi:translocation and assembly module TamB
MVAWGPFLGVAIVGGIYLLDCFQTLLSPGTGIELDLETPGGMLKLRCKNYSYSPQLGVLMVKGVELRDPSGKLLVRAPQLKIQGLKLDGSIAPQVKAVNGELFLTRKKSGKLDIQNYLGPSSDEPSQIAYKVDLTNCRIFFRDQASKGEPVNEVFLSRASIMGLGETLSISTKTQLDDALKGKFWVEKSGDNFSVRARNIDADLVSVLERVRVAPESKQLKVLDELQIASGKLSGNIDALVGKKIVTRADLKAELNNLKWKRYQLSNGDIKCLVSEQGASGELKLAAGDRAKIEVSGTTNFKSGIIGGFEINGVGINPKTLQQLGVALPKQTNFNTANAKGWLGISKGQPLFAGDASVTSFAYDNVRLPNINAKVAYANDQLAASFSKLSLLNSNADAVLGVSTKTGEWKVTANSPRLSVNDLAQFVPSELRGTTGQVSTELQGKGSSFSGKAQGILDANVKLNGKSFRYPNSSFALRFTEKGVDVDRALIEHPTGKALFTGRIPKSGQLSGKVSALGIDLSPFGLGLKGSVDTSGTLSGTLTNPQFIGSVRSYQLTHESIPGNLSAVSANLSANKNFIQLKDIIAVRKTAQLTGEVGYRFKGDALSGTLDGKSVDVQELNKGPVNGYIDILGAKISGTSRSPRVTAQVKSDQIIASGFPFTNLETQAEFSGNALTLLSGSAEFGTAKANGISGSFDVASRSGSFTASFNSLSPDDLIERWQARQTDLSTLDRTKLVFSGLLSGESEIKLKRGELSSIQIAGKADNLKVNDSFIGSGEWSVAFKDSKWFANGQIGALEDYIALDGFSYNPNNGVIGGALIGYNIPLQEIITAGQPFIEDQKAIKDALSTVDGKLSFSATASGLTSSAVVKVDSFNIPQLTFGESKIGEIVAEGIISPELYRLSNFEILGTRMSTLQLPFGGRVELNKNVLLREGTAKFSGQLANQNEISLTGEINNFPLGKFGGLFPSAKPLDVFLSSAKVDIIGTTDAPKLNLVASATTPLNLVKNQSQRAKVDVDARIEAESGIHGVGKVKFSYLNLESVAGLDAWFDRKFAVDDSKPFNAYVGFEKPQDLSAFVRNLKDFDLGGDSLKVSGKIVATDRFSDPKISGGINLESSEIRYNAPSKALGGSLNTAIKEFKTRIFPVKKEGIGWTLQNEGEFSTNMSFLDPNTPGVGLAKWKFGIPIQDFVDFDFKKKDPLDREILNGEVNLNRVSFAQQFPKDAYVTLRTNTPQPITVSGTLLKPTIKGQIDLDNARTALPSFEAEQADDSPAVIDPTFDLNIRLTSPAEIRNSIAFLKVGGQTTIKGNLKNLRATGRLGVEQGTISLPGGKVKLQEGGTLDLNYRADSLDNPTQLIANLQGETALTAVRNSLTPERYDIFIKMTGDMMKQDGLALDATSQPADLTKERILQLLGRTDLLQNVLQTGVTSDIEEDVRNTITGIALPSLLGGVTNSLARNLGFEYVSVDYNPFEQASINFAKSLGKGFFMQGRRQVLPPLPGQPVAYDFRLAYRPRRGPEAIRALSFSLGIDQFRPYKFSIDYSQQVHQRKAPYRVINLGVENK